MESYEPLSINELTVELGGKKVVKSVSLTVASGDWLSIIGPNAVSYTHLRAHET